MEMFMRKFFSPGRILAVLPLVFGLAQQIAAQSTPISDYTSLLNAINAGTTPITNFQSPITISWAAHPAIQITGNVTINAGTNSVIFQGTGLTNGTHFFNVAPNATLTLNNFELTGGGSTNGGAIYNAGTLVVSNCLFLLNFATNTSGVNGASGPIGIDSNGANGTSGGNAAGGAIYSTGPVSISYSQFTSNFALAGNGGNGGNAGGGFGDGGNAGNGGNASGGAIFSTGSNNVFYMTEFTYNDCVAGFGGAGGSFATNEIPAEGSGGVAGLGGSSAGGVAYITGPLYMTNCLFYENECVAGNTGPAEVDSSTNSLQGGADGSPGGYAIGGGLFITNTTVNAWIQNSIFFFNQCYGGNGGSTALNAAVGGTGGQALGGGVFSGAALTQMSFCTLATNLVFAGIGGTNTDAGFSGAAGVANGWNIYKYAGIFDLGDSILSYDDKGTNDPNAVGVTDGGYNVSSDASFAPSAINPGTLRNTDPLLNSGLSPDGINIGGTFGSQMLTLALLSGSPAGGLVRGVPGLTFPATDESLADRQTPTSAGAFELNPILSIETNASQFLTIFSTNALTNQVGAGQSVSFPITVYTNTIDVSLSYGYQWQHAGTNITNSANYSGTTSGTLVIKDINAGDEGPYTVVVSPTLLEGMVSNSPVLYLVLTNPPSIVKQPASQLNRPEGSIVTFTLDVGPYPQAYNYQWMLNGTNLVPGTNSNVLTIDPALTSDAGTYSVIVSNNYFSKTSAPVRLTVVPDHTKPTVVILSPVANVRTNNVVIEGTATDNAQVTTVRYWITNLNGLIPVTNVTVAGNATLTTNGNTNLNTATTTVVWSITNTPLPGTNILAVQSVDYSGNVSTVLTRRFFYQVTNELSLTFNEGTVFGGSLTGHSFIKDDVAPANLALLNIGEGYSIVAAPNSTSLLGTWTTISGTHVEITNGTTLKFIMESNMAIQALFVSNIFLDTGIRGTYNGLFYVTATNSVVTNETVTNLVGTNQVATNELVTNVLATNAIAFESAGMLDNLVLSKEGTFSGKLLLAGGSYALSGAFDAFGRTTNQVARSEKLGGPLIVDMNLDTNGAGIMTGAVTNSTWQSNATLLANLTAATSGASNYTLLMLPPTNAPANNSVPAGDGYALITDHAGTITLSGGLADGTTFSQTVPASQSNDVPVYISLYAKTGLLIGWLNLTNLDSTNEAGGLAWIKGLQAHPSVLFPDGFTETLQTEGSPWIIPDAVTLPSSNTLTISNADLDLNYTVAISDNDKLIIDTSAPSNSLNSLTGTINLKTGQLEITFGDGGGNATTKGYGAMLQNTNSAGGYFVTKTNTGSITLQP
jgi:hypothetical protein